tara:strand:+ start:5249 stop:6388 length:1140 start_codon:yes stop_codon:yes gene_type:complete
MLNKMNKKLIYLTYQTFPAPTANTIQTIDNVKYLFNKGYEVKVVFPMRSELSSDKVKDLQNYYEFKEEIEFKGLEHKLPFGKFKIFEKYSFLISHYLWAKKACKQFGITKYENIQFFTRSDWVFFFLSKRKLKVLFECHQLSKTRKWVLKKSIINPNSKVIFLNENLKLDSGINNKKFIEKIEVIPNGVDSKLFNFPKNKDPYQIVFTGNLKRFNDDRGLNFIIDSFKSKNMPDDYSLLIIGGSLEEVQNMRRYVSKEGLDNKIKIIERVNRSEVISNIEKAGIGLLINTSNNTHSTRYTSPLKYFEFLYAGLKIVAVDFPSHRSLPFSDKIYFFTENQTESFLDALNNLSTFKTLKENKISSITLTSRANKIDEFIKK